MEVMIIIRILILFYNEQEFWIKKSLNIYILLYLITIYYDQSHLRKSMKTY